MDVPHTLVVTNDYPPRVGGIQRTLEALVDQLPPDRVSVLCPGWDEAEAFDADEHNGPALNTVLEEAADKALLAEIERRHGPIDNAVANGAGFREAYVEASELEPVVARFFEEVFVMSDDARLRQARLRLMKRLELLILQLGDISEIVASE